MTHPHQSKAEEATAHLMKINGVFACAVRAHADPADLDATVQAIAKDASNGDLSTATVLAAQVWVQGTPPFPHVVAVGDASDDLAHYLRGMTDLLGAGYDEEISSRVGETRMITQSWKHLIIGVAIAMKDPAVKSLSRNLRRVRRLVEE